MTPSLPATRGDADPVLHAAKNAASQVPDACLVTLGGSRAYGTDRPGSDLDLSGVYVAPLRKVLALRGAEKSYRFPDRDVTFFELAHFCKLASSANPTILEMLWAPILFGTINGARLRVHRDLFLSKRVLRTYGGYAVSQLRKADAGSGGSRGVEHFKREKFLMHTLRLLDTGVAILRTGEVPVRVADPDALWDRARRPLEAVAAEADVLLRDMDAAAAASALPDEPDHDAIDRMVYEIRTEHLR